MGHRRKPLWMCTMYVRTLALVLIEEYQYQYVTVSVRQCLTYILKARIAGPKKAQI